MPPPDDETRPPDDAPAVDPAGEPVPDVRLPRGCNPLTFGVVMATLEMGVFLWLWQRCS